MVRRSEPIVAFGSKPPSLPSTLGVPVGPSPSTPPVPVEVVPDVGVELGVLVPFVVPEAPAALEQTKGVEEK